MRVIFMGTPEFACASLERLYEDGHEVVGVFTQPDRPRNRGMKVSVSPVKALAMEHGTRVFQPESLKSGMEAAIRGLNGDIIVVVAYGRILPTEILRINTFGCINIHASLLPKYRGAAPIQWAIINGETETGVTSLCVNEELDAGDILLSTKTQIGDDETSGDLYKRLSASGAALLSETLEALIGGKVTRKPQNRSDVTVAPPLHRGLSPIIWTESAYSIKCKVRGLNPWPVATAEVCGKTCKIFSVDIGSVKPCDAEPGAIISSGRHGIEIACADRAIILKELQAPGGRRMKAEEYIRGNRT